MSKRTRKRTYDEVYLKRLIRNLILSREKARLLVYSDCMPSIISAINANVLGKGICIKTFDYDKN